MFVSLPLPSIESSMIGNTYCLDLGTSATGCTGRCELSEIYERLEFPAAPPSRPYCFINMVTTIDGKILSGERGEPVEDLGSKVDHDLMRKIQGSADAVLIGAGAQRSSPKIWYPGHLLRFVATRSGNVLTPSRFFDDEPEKAFVICSESAVVSEGLKTVRVGDDNIDWVAGFEILRGRFGVEKLLVEGGSDINAQILALDLVDELFMTLAPKVKLGKDVPTYADGEPLSREHVQQYELIESNRSGDEMFLRYRRHW